MEGRGGELAGGGAHHRELGDAARRRRQRGGGPGLARQRLPARWRRWCDEGGDARARARQRQGGGLLYDEEGVLVAARVAEAPDARAGTRCAPACGVRLPFPRVAGLRPLAAPHLGLRPLDNCPAGGGTRDPTASRPRARPRLGRDSTPLLVVSGCVVYVLNGGQGSPITLPSPGGEQRRGAPLRGTELRGRCACCGFESEWQSRSSTRRSCAASWARGASATTHSGR